MDQLIQEFPEHVTTILNQLKGRDLKIEYPEKVKNIVLCGLGGSGIGGKLTQKLVEPFLEVPFQIINDYNVPNYVDENTLVIANSYSGNTEETLQALDQSVKRGAQVFAISSNGELLKKAEENKWTHVQVKGGYPPRAALAFSFVTQLIFLQKNGWVKEDFITEIQAANSFVEKQAVKIRESAAALAKKIENKNIVLYADQWLEGVVVRGRQQINENAKLLCWHHVFPEMNHNETVGWASGNDQMAVLILRSNFDYERTNTRIEITEGIIKKKTPHVFNIKGEGDTKITQTFYFIHFLDWLSYELSALKNVDPIEVDVIDYLKGELAKS